ncbi:MAG: glycosyltransferase 87 family protein [Chloroflexota bacterium]|nr:glycosyltransferase 87 family protein [Chloroflexota bacterium]
MTRIRRTALRVWPYAPALLVLISEWRLIWPVPALVDHFQFWSAGHAVATGQSPYDRATWEAAAAYGPVPGGIAVNTVIENLRHTSFVWPYPPQSAFLFAPFGALPLEIGIPAMHAVVLVAAAASVTIAARIVGLDGVRLAVGLLLAALSQPFIVGVRAGHPIGIFVLALLACFVGLRDRRLPLLIGGVIILSTKPQLGIALGVFALGVLISRRDWGAIGAIVATLVTVTFAANLRSPFPLAQLLGTGGEWLSVDLSTAWGLSRDLGGGTELSFLLIASAVASVIVAVRIASGGLRNSFLLGGLMALSLAVTPYAHDYDMLLLLPAAFVVVASSPRPRVWSVGIGLLLILALPWLLFMWWPLLGQGARVYQGGPLGALPLITAWAMPVAAWITARHATVTRPRVFVADGKDDVRT